MINVIEDIAKIMKNDKLHNVKVVVEPSGVTVFLDEKEYESIIPIKYNCVEGIYISNEEQQGVIGICEIGIIKNIMEYLEDHTSELNELGDKCDWSGRQEEN